MTTSTLPRPRDRKPIAEGTCEGVGRQGDEEEEDLEQQPHPEEHPEFVAAARESDEKTEPADASWDQGVDQDEEACPLPVPRRRQRLCERV